MILPDACAIFWWILWERLAAQRLIWTFEDGGPDERGVTCNFEDMAVSIRGDRIELHCADFSSRAAEVGAVLTEIWPGLNAIRPSAAAKTHSFLFEADAEIREGSYQEVLNRLASVPPSFPTRTETAVVYYLPAEPHKGYGESSLVLSRSDEVQGGIQINAS